LHVVPGLRQQVRVPSLPARDVEDPRPDWLPHHLDESSDLATILLEGEERLVLEEILLVEVRCPPRRRAFF
jgi:hypothetical protein